jgi:vitamin B12 transporter
MKLLFALVILLGLSFSLFSSSQQLDDIVVVGSPVRDNVIGDFSVNKIVLDIDYIKSLNANDVVSVLNHISSVSLMGEGIFGSRTVGRERIKIRGNNPKIMIDGRPVSMDYFNCVVNNVLTLNGVERIEVIRGGESVLSGTDGLGGVINIITKTPEYYSSNIFTKIGSYNTALINLQTNNRKERSYYSLSYDYKTTDGHIDFTNLKSNDFFVKAGYYIKDNIRTEISGKYYAGKYDDPLKKDNEEEWDKDRYGINFNVDGHWNRHSFLIQTHATYGEHKKYVLADGEFNFHSKDKIEGIRSYHKINFSNFELLYGFDYRRYGGKEINTTTGDYDRIRYENEKAPYAVFKTNFGNNELVLGARFNNNSLYGNLFLHKFGFKRNFTDVFSMLVSTNKTFRTPSIRQTFSPNDLDPEIATNYELSSTYTGFDLFNIDLALFYIDGKDRITGFPPNNVQEYSHYGLELDLTKQILSNLFATLSYTYIDPDEDTQFQFRNKISGIINYNISKFNLTSSYAYINKYYASGNKTNRLPDYLKLDVRAQYRQSEKMNYFIEIDNLLDKDYALQVYDDGSEMYNSGLTVYAGLDVIF